MIEFGNTLKSAREAKGLSIDDLAKQTHIMSSVIADLENEDFTRLPAPIYGRGFVKLYCEAVGIEAAPLTAEFMEIYNGNREPAIRERVIQPTPPAPAPEPAPEPTPAPRNPVSATTPSPTPANDPLDLFSMAAPEKPAPVEPRPVETKPVNRHPLSAYAMPLRERAAEMKGYLPAAGRIIVIVALLGALAWGLIVGIRALYRATSGTQTENDPALAERVEAPAAVPTEKTARTPLDVPSLYID